MITPIFGDADSMQSSLQLEDIALENAEIVFRDGVRIDGDTGIGVAGGKYDYEAVERGAHGKLRMSMTLRRCHELDASLNSIARLMKRLELGIRLGALIDSRAAYCRARCSPRSRFGRKIPRRRSKFTSRSRTSNARRRSDWQSRCCVICGSDWLQSAARSRSGAAHSRAFPRGLSTAATLTNWIGTAK